MQTFQKKYTAPIAARFNAAAPFNFTTNDIIGMQQLCGYETVITGKLAETGFDIRPSSPFCAPELFTPDEWLGFEYSNDLMYFHNTGYGNPVSGAIGFPWVESTINLLSSDSPVDQDLYVSFTHRELPPTVLVALGLFNNSAFSGSNNVNATMPLDTINPNRVWMSSRILPFLTNIALERMECDSFGFPKGQYHRVLVNNAPQPLPDCTDGPGESCSIARMKAYIGQRKTLLGGFSQMCGVMYANTTDTLGVYWTGASSGGGSNGAPGGTATALGSKTPPVVSSNAAFKPSVKFWWMFILQVALMFCSN